MCYCSSAFAFLSFSENMHIHLWNDACGLKQITHQVFMLADSHLFIKTNKQTKLCVFHLHLCVTTASHVCLYFIQM